MARDGNLFSCGVCVCAVAMFRGEHQSAAPRRQIWLGKSLKWLGLALVRLKYPRLFRAATSAHVPHDLKLVLRFICILRIGVGSLCSTLDCIDSRLHAHSTLRCAAIAPTLSTILFKTSTCLDSRLLLIQQKPGCCSFILWPDPSPPLCLVPFQSHAFEQCCCAQASTPWLVYPLLPPL